jgi:DNA mismatch repair protein MutS2
MTNTVRIMESCGENTLLLFDELGAGTDPTEGAALAMSIIEYARARGAFVAATTHYAELKVYATNTKGVQNASCEFDVETLRPTYRLLVGIPGKSNAFAISARLGLSEEIIEDAKSRVGTESASFEATIEKLEQQRRQLEKYTVEAEQKLRDAEESARKANRMEAELSVRLEKADEKARRDAQRILDEARETAEQVFAELDEMKSRQNEQEDHRRVNEARAELRRRLNDGASKYTKPDTTLEDNKEPSRPVKVGDTVKIRSMGIKAEVVSISPDRVLELQAGIMRVTAKENEVILLENEPKAKKKPVGGVTASNVNTARVGAELDIRGMMTDEVIPVVERYIDGAVMSKLNSVTIIHGKGTGALRAAVQESLKKNKQVKSYRLGRFGEGETGVTIVELK